MTALGRRLMLCLPAGLAPVPARAFRLEAPNADLARDYAAGCPATQAHAALAAELDRLREGRPLPPEPEQRLASLARCPFCGCSVTGETNDR